VSFYYADMMYLGTQGHLFPYDIRFDPADPAHLEGTPDGGARFRLVTETGFAGAHLVRQDGVGIAMDLVGQGRHTQVWQTFVAPDELPRRYTFALRTDDGLAVYRVPAGVGNAVERLDRWTLDRESLPAVVVPEWARGATIYQIFPDRFANGDPTVSPEGAAPWGTEPRWLDFQGGDLIGIAQRLDYLAELGVDAVYLNPIFTSPSTHRYDAVDYYQVDPVLGGNDGLRLLIDALHARDMRLIVDASFNHCHPKFFAFADLLENGEDSAYRDWFIVNDFPLEITVRPGMMEEAGWHADPDEYLEFLRRFESDSGVIVTVADDDGPVLTTSYDAWYGVPSLPRIDLTNPEAAAYFLDVARYWVDFGIDGWRMDVARYVDYEFWPRFRTAVKAVNADTYLIAEIMGDASDWLGGDSFDATMNYTFRALCLDFLATGRTDATDLAEGLLRMYAAYAPGAAAVSQNLIGSHDTPRFRHEAAEDPGALRLATVLQMTLPGAPGLYYGDEVGMTGGEEPASRGAFPWHDEASWDLRQLEAVRELGRLRAKHPALRHGTFRTRFAGGDIIAFEREHADERLLVVINRGPADRVWLPVSGAARVIWGTGTVASVGAGIAVEVPATAAAVLSLTTTPAA